MRRPLSVTVSSRVPARPVAIGLSILLSCLFLSGCGSKGETQTPPAAALSGGGTDDDPQAGPGLRRDVTPGPLGQLGLQGKFEQLPDLQSIPSAPKKLPEVVVHTNAGDITIRLHEDKAPVTVLNFLSYVERGFYDNTIFHYVHAGAMIIGGGYTSDLQLKPHQGEIFNEAHNRLQNKRGTVAMARDPNNVHSASCQFFVNLADNPSLDHQGSEPGQNYGYCVFGEVVEGMDVVDRIGSVPVQDTPQLPKVPTQTVVIQSVQRTK